MYADSESQSQKGRGTAIIIKKKWAPYVQKREDTYTVPGGITTIHIKYKDFELIAACYYAPPISSEGAKTKRKKMNAAIARIIAKHKNKIPVLIIGDFNTAMNPKIDRYPQNRS